MQLPFCRLTFIIASQLQTHIIKRSTVLHLLSIAVPVKIHKYVCSSHWYYQLYETEIYGFK
jgi:hypothetical protein